MSKQFVGRIHFKVNNENIKGLDIRSVQVASSSFQETFDLLYAKVGVIEGKHGKNNIDFLEAFIELG